MVVKIAIYVIFWNIHAETSVLERHLSEILTTFVIYSLTDAHKYITLVYLPAILVVQPRVLPNGLGQDRGNLVHVQLNGHVRPILYQLAFRLRAVIYHVTADYMQQVAVHPLAVTYPHSAKLNLSHIYSPLQSLSFVARPLPRRTACSSFRLSTSGNSFLHIPLHD